MEFRDCRYDENCEGCPLAELPDGEKFQTGAAVQLVVRAQEKKCGKAGKLSTEELTKLGRRAVGQVRLPNPPESSVIVLDAMTKRNRGECYVSYDE